VQALVVLIPVLRRPHRVQHVLSSLHANTPEPCRALFIASPGDEEEHAAIRRCGADMIIVDGNYAAKINEGVRQTTEPLLFLGADDLQFHPRWLEHAKRRIKGGVMVVGTNDLCNRRVMRGEHSTHSLLTRAYTHHGTIDDPTRLLHEGYLHEYVDDEFVGTAQHRRAFASAHDSIVEHLHPQVQKAPVDELYAAQHARMRRSVGLYRQRRRLWTSA
jgi:hypothetical protein